MLASENIPKELLGKRFAQKKKVYMDGVGSIHFPNNKARVSQKKFFTTISSFDENLHVSPKFGFFTKIWIFH